MLVAMSVGLLFGCGKADTDAVKKAESTEVNKSAETKIKKIGVGEIAEYEDIQILVHDFKETSGNEWFKPDKGNKFVYVNLEVANNTSEDLSLNSLISFEGYQDDYKLENNTDAFIAMEDGYQKLDGNLSPGKKIKGWIGFEVSKDWKVLEVKYMDDVWKDSNYMFEIKNDKK